MATAKKKAGRPKKEEPKKLTGEDRERAIFDLGRQIETDNELIAAMKTQGAQADLVKAVLNTTEYQRGKVTVIMPGNQELELSMTEAKGLMPSIEYERKEVAKTVKTLTAQVNANTKIREQLLKEKQEDEENQESQ